MTKLFEEAKLEWIRLDGHNIITTSGNQTQEAGSGEDQVSGGGGDLGGQG